MFFGKNINKYFYNNIKILEETFKWNEIYSWLLSFIDFRKNLVIYVEDTN